MDQRSMPERFPVIGRHLISERNPAYAPTEPPQENTPMPALVPKRPLSFLARLYLGFRRWLA